MTKTSVSLNLLRFNSESDENIFASYKFSKGWRRTTKENWVTFFSCSSRFFFSLFSAGGSDDAAVGVDDDDLDAAVEVDVDDDDVAVILTRLDVNLVPAALFCSCPFPGIQTVPKLGP